MTTPGGGAPDGAFVIGSAYGQDVTEQSFNALMRGQGTQRGFVDANTILFQSVLGGFANVIDAIFATADNAYISQLPIIQEQQNYITDLIEAVERMILQGQSVIYDSNNTHYISDGVTSIDFIILGSGGGGGGFSGGLVQSTIGRGGGGGGEVHVNVPRSLLGDSFEVLVGAGGAGGIGGSAGGGGTPSKIITPDGEIVAGGGQGGMSLSPESSGQNKAFAQGGSGMIPGGRGGSWWANCTAEDMRGGSSVSQYSLNGGGGGGGSGGQAGYPWGTGGQGGITSGGALGQSGGPSDGIVATGGGGGGGNTDGDGGHGGFPSGGGGGAWRQGTTARNGGNGGNGRVYVIERTT